jgi:hypothetical protein
MKATKQRTIKASIGDSSKLVPKVRSAFKGTYRVVFKKRAQGNSSKTAAVGLLLSDRDVSDELRKPSVIIATATRKSPKSFGK